MKQYHDLVQHVLDNGTRKENRTGVDTLSTFNYNYEIDLDEGFPMLTTKKISWKNIVIELLWFLSGDYHTKFLEKHNCKFWDAWVDDDGRVPSAYGSFWRRFPVQKSCSPDDIMDWGPYGTNDQLGYVIRTLRENPDSRRLVVSAWYPDNAQNSKLPPCHCMYIFNVQYKDGEPRLCLHLTQRSCDVALGIPYNIASYALLLHLIGQMTDIKPWLFAHTLVDAHIYTSKPDGSMEEHDHVPGLKEQITREPYSLPTLTITPAIRDLFDIENIIYGIDGGSDIREDFSTDKILEMFKLDGYISHPNIKFKVAV